MKRFITWLFQTNESGVIVSKWLTEEENQECANCTHSQFWDWYEVALERKSNDEFRRGLSWFIIIGIPFAILAFFLS